MLYLYYTSINGSFFSHSQLSYQTDGKYCINSYGTQVHTIQTNLHTKVKIVDEMEKFLRPITSAHESNLDNNYSNLQHEKQVSSDDECSSSHNNKAYNFGMCKRSHQKSINTSKLEDFWLGSGRGRMKERKRERGAGRGR